MSSLLPNNATTLETALAKTIARISDVPTPARDVWNADTCPNNLLPWLAWAFSVDEWDTGWSDAQKRAAIKAAVEVQRHKGTIGAVRSALGALGFGAQVQEWFNQLPAGQPYTYTLLLESNQVGIDQAALQTILQVVDRNKNLRSHMADMKTSAVTRAGPVIAGASSLGNEITIKFGGGNLISNGFALSDGTYKSNGFRGST